MADAPTFEPITDPPSPNAEPITSTDVIVWPRARASYAAWAGTVDGSSLVYADRQALAVYLGSGSPPTRNRGRRGWTRTTHPVGGLDRGGGLWRF